MKNFTKLSKAKKLLEDDKIFLLSSSDKYDYYIVKGNKPYTVTYNKNNNKFNCDCKNIRLDTECYHILGIRLFRESQNEPK